MKKISTILTGLLFSSSLLIAQEKKQIEISGTVTGVTTGKVYLQKFNNKIFSSIDSAEIKNGKFLLSKQLLLPELYGLTINKDESPLYVFLEAGKVTVNLDTAKYYKNSKVQGSASNDLFTAYKKQGGVKIEEFIQQNPKSIVPAYVLYRDFSYRLTPEEIKTNVALLDPSFKNSQYVTVLNDLVNVLNKVSVGKKAPDFKAQTPEGKTISLVSQQGKYLLIDFWAAWCGPCRRENPNLVKAYQKYHNKGFDILGVSLDKSKADWVKAIKDDHLNWAQVSDLSYWNSAPAKLYGVRAIPANVLIDPKGIIIARNLRGEDLDKKLEELLGTKLSSTGK